jgi:hypothetical protein
MPLFIPNFMQYMHTQYIPYGQLYLGNLETLYLRSTTKFGDGLWVEMLHFNTTRPIFYR